MAKPSAESLSIAAVSIPVRPDPPAELTPYEAKVWNDVVSTKPPEWFESDSYPLLKAYCIAAGRHYEIGLEIKNHLIQSPEARDLMRLEDMYAKQLKGLATSMRLTQQSRYTPGAAATANKKAASGKKPWE